MKPQFYIQLLYRPHLGTWILPFGLLGSKWKISETTEFLLKYAKLFKKGMDNLKYLKPSDEGILQFLSYITEIWSRDQFFHENQLCFRSGVIFWWNKGCKRGKFLFLSDFLGVSYLQMAVIHSIFELGYSNFGNWKYSRATKTTLLCDFFICLVKNRAI